MNRTAARIGVVGASPPLSRLGLKQRVAPMSQLPLIVTTQAETRAAIKAARDVGKRIGLVPTMGALHRGHLRLIEQARHECGLVVVSIFVNPTQFGPSEDFARYPRDLERDRETCAMAHADLIFAPSVAEMYPRGADATVIAPPSSLTATLEGAIRPGHFQGVATVVAKLFGICAPDLAYFGEKDYQQLLVIRRLVADLGFGLMIRPVPTAREPDGLALSSRNQYLDAAERQAATVLSRALEQARHAVRGGERSADRVRQVLSATVESERSANIDYVAVADPETLAPLDVVPSNGAARALLAVRFGNTRLIDNASLSE